MSPLRPLLKNTERHFCCLLWFAFALLLWFLMSISAICCCFFTGNALEMVALLLMINIALLQVVWETNTSFHANRCVHMNAYQPTKRVGAVCLLATIINPWEILAIQWQIQKQCVCVWIFISCLYSICVAFSIISIFGLTASNYISNKEPQWEDSPLQQCIWLFVFTDNVATISLLKYVQYVVFLWQINY